MGVISRLFESYGIGPCEIEIEPCEIKPYGIEPCIIEFGPCGIKAL